MNQKLINDLREGKIVLHNEPKNPEAVKQILKEAFPKDTTTAHGNSNYYFYSNSIINAVWGSCDNLPKTHKLIVIPIADFLRPEPKFKVGDKVIVSDYPLFKEAVIKEAKQNPDTGNWAYMVSDGMTGSYISEDLLSPVSEQNYEIGKVYEFSDWIETGWVKGKLLAIVEDEYKYIARVGADKEPSGWQRIRPIHPTKVERWINMSQSGNQVGKKCFESEMEACQHAPQSQNVFQVKLEGYASI